MHTQTHQHLKHAQIDVVRATQDFHSQLLSKNKENMVKMEKSINIKDKKMSKNQVEVELNGWIPDPGYSTTCDTKLFKLIELYWLNKAFVS